MRQRLLADFVAMCCLVGNDFLRLACSSVSAQSPILIPIGRFRWFYLVELGFIVKPGQTFATSSTKAQHVAAKQQKTTTTKGTWQVDWSVCCSLRRARVRPVVHHARVPYVCDPTQPDRLPPKDPGPQYHMTARSL